jgi:hypothetical protein
MFSVGDFIVEQARAGEPESFGVVLGLETAINGSSILEVQFPTEKLYTFACQCRHYKDWLHENNF